MTRRPEETEPPVPQHEPPHPPGVVPVGTLMLVAVVLLCIVWLWMLVLGLQQGRA